MIIPIKKRRRRKNIKKVTKCEHINEPYYSKVSVHELLSQVWKSKEVDRLRAQRQEDVCTQGVQGLLP